MKDNIISYSEILENVIHNLKNNIPAYKTLSKYGWKSKDFYSQLSAEDKRYIHEIKCLKTTRCTPGATGSGYEDTANFEIYS